MTSQRLTGSFAFSPIGNAATATLDHAHLSRATLVPDADSKHARGTVDWGDCLRPHHFAFEEGTTVRPRMATRPDIICHAVSVLGAGRFQESPSSEPVSFNNGGIIVKGGDRYKFLTLETFRRHFVLEDGQAIETVYQIDMQTPKK